MSYETLIFAAAVIAILGVGLSLSWTSTRKSEARDRDTLHDAHYRGLNLPVSLHPVIDTTVCIGSRACVTTCPEQDVLGVIGNRGTLLAGANCVGHGACATSCPVDAIRLVFGTAERGVELPKVSPNFESSVPGVYIAGELGGMGLIANAFEQAIQAIDGIAAELGQDNAAPTADDDTVDIAIIGAGPAGLAASLRAKELGLSYACLEQGTWGGALRMYPRAKVVMTRPVRVPLFGPVKLRETTKEALLSLWDEILQETEVKIRTETRVLGIDREGELHRVRLETDSVLARRVLLAVGRRGTPKLLGVPGDAGANVTTHLIEPERWTGQSLAVVGGGDVAAEAALSLCEQPDTTVTLVYRGSALYRPKAALRDKLAAATEAGHITVMLNSGIDRVEPDALIVTQRGTEHRLAVDQVFACLGGTAPVELLQQVGVTMVTKFGEA